MKKFNFNGEETVLTIGKFGVLHKGHERLLSRLFSISKARKLKPAILTFSPSPALFFSQNEMKHGRIFSIPYILQIIKKNFNLEFSVFLQKFDSKFASTKPENFVEFLKKKLNIKCIIVGKNFNFGKDRSGTVEILKQLSIKYGIDVVIEDLVNEISTTNLRIMLQEGKIEEFNSNLAFGEKYQLTGVIQRGCGLASKELGFKTANFKLKSALVMPQFGVYSCKISVLGKEFNGIINIGIKPSIDGTTPLAEVHIFNFSQEIYGKKIKVILEKFIRKEEKFSSLDDLKNQIRKDIASVIQ